MKAVILAGGLRSGHEVEGLSLPRALWPFPQQPLISQVIRFLRNAGIGEIAVCANGKTKLIAAELAKLPEPWPNLHFSEDAVPRGPAGCLRDLTSWLGNEPFVAIQGTGHFAFDLNALQAQHSRSTSAITIGAKVSGDDAQSLEPAGVYMINPDVLTHVPGVGFQDIKEQLIPKAQSAGALVDCHVVRGKALLVHSTQHYLAALADVLGQHDQVYVHPEASVSPRARLRGPVWVDAGAVIDERAVIVGPSLIGRGVHVGAGALLHRVAMFERSRVKAGGELFAQVVGMGVEVGKRPVSATRRPDARDGSQPGSVARWLETLAWPRPRRVVAARGECHLTYTK